MSIPILSEPDNPSRRELPGLPISPHWPVKCYVRTLFTERQVRICIMTKGLSTPQTPRSDSTSSTTTLAAPAIRVPEGSLRNLSRFSDADQAKAGAHEIIIRRSDSDSDLTRPRTRDSDGHDSWEDAGFHHQNRHILSFNVWLDLDFSSTPPDPGDLRREIDLLYMQVAF